MQQNRWEMMMFVSWIDKDNQSNLIPMSGQLILLLITSFVLKSVQNIYQFIFIAIKIRIFKQNF